MRWQAGVTDLGEHFSIDDPIAARLAEAGGVDDYLALLGADLDRRARGTIAEHFAALERGSARAAIERLIGVRA
jgi:fructuronate reductase